MEQDKKYVYDGHYVTYIPPSPTYNIGECFAYKGWGGWTYCKVIDIKGLNSPKNETYIVNCFTFNSGEFEWYEDRWFHIEQIDKGDSYPIPTEEFDKCVKLYNMFKASIKPIIKSFTK